MIELNREYNRLTPKEVVGRDTANNLMCRCDCICGNAAIIRCNYVESGHTKSCGCLEKENRIALAIRATTHGLTKTREHNCWCEIKRRCYNKNTKSYKNYGERGIVMCDRWLNSFENFLEDMGKCPEGDYSIDRIDNDGDYCPENCKWETKANQCRNRRTNIELTYQNKTQVIADWAKEQFIVDLELKEHHLYARYHRGWSTEKILSTPPMVEDEPTITWNGKTQTLSEWAEETGVDRALIKGRYNKNWTPEDILSKPKLKQNKDLIEFNGKKQTISNWAIELGIGRTTLFHRFKEGWSIEKTFTTPLIKGRPGKRS